MVLKVIILVWSLITFGSAFQVLGADALNDLSPNVTFYRQVGSSRISPLDADRRECLLFPLIDSRLLKYCRVLGHYSSNLAKCHFWLWWINKTVGLTKPIKKFDLYTGKYSPLKVLSFQNFTIK